MRLAFYLLLFLVFIDYLGIHRYLSVFRSLPIALALSFGLFFFSLSKQKVGDLWCYKQFRFYIYFTVLTALAIIHGLIRTYAVDHLKPQIGYLMLLVAVAVLVSSDKKNFNKFFGMFVLTHVLMVLDNVDKFGASREGVFKAGYFLGDGNDFAWSLNVALPLSVYLLFTSKKFLVKSIFLVSSLILVFGIVGTQSRGSALALTAGILYYLFFVTKNKSKAMLLLTVIAFGVLAFAPSTYFSRMQTISSYEEDTSAMGRIRAWNAAARMALDNPVLGVGAGSFNSAYGRGYRQADDPQRWISTHSIYFKVLAEYGFTGIILLLLIIVSNLKLNSQTTKLILKHKEHEALSPQLPSFLSWSLISYSVAATFLTGLNYPHLYILSGLSMGAHLCVQRAIRGHSTK